MGLGRWCQLNGCDVSLPLVLLQWIPPSVNILFHDQHTIERLNDMIQRLQSQKWR